MSVKYMILAALIFGTIFGLLRWGLDELLGASPITYISLGIAAACGWFWGCLTGSRT